MDENEIAALCGGKRAKLRLRARARAGIAPTPAQVEADNRVKSASEFLRFNQHRGKSETTCLYIASLLDVIKELTAAAQVGEPQHSVDFLEGVAEGKAATIERCKQVAYNFDGYDWDEVRFAIAAALDKLKDEP